MRRPLLNQLSKFIKPKFDVIKMLDINFYKKSIKYKNSLEEYGNYKKNCK